MPANQREKTTLLITSVGSQVGEGIIRSIGSRREKLRIVGVNSLADNPVNFDCDSVYLCPPVAEALAFESVLKKILAGENPSLVIPGRDDDILALAELGRHDGNLRQCLPMGELDLCKSIRNKLLVYQYAQANDLPFCMTLDLADRDIPAKAASLTEKHGWPLLIKPKDGQGSEDVWIIPDLSRLERWFGNKHYVLQPYLSANTALSEWLDSFQFGVPIHSTAPGATQDVVQVILGPDSSPQGIFGMHTQMRAGRSWHLMPNQDERLLDVGRHFSEVLGRDGWCGPLNIQTRYHDGQYLPFEINGRFNGTSSSRAELGFDEIRMTVEAFTGVDLGQYQGSAGDIIHRRSQDYAVYQQQLTELESQGVWHAPG